MTQTVVENEICPTCGTELPATAEFCYHCGNSVKVEAVSENETQDVSDVWLRGDIAKKSDTNNNKATQVSGQNLETAVQDNNLKKDLEDFRTKPVETELKSAASLRVKARKIPTKKVEVHWEEHDNAPNILFIGGAILLAIFALLIFFLAMYLR